LSTTRQLSNSVESNIPRWLWRLSWTLLAGALLFTVVGAIVLSLGIADPPYAGPKQLSIPKTDLISKPTNFLNISSLPFTIETKAVFPASAVWSFSLKSGDKTALHFELYDDKTFTIRAPAEVLRASFPHLRGAGEQTCVRIDVAANGETILRFNNEIAWRGTIDTSQNMIFQSGFSLSGNPVVNPGWDQLTLYTSSD
jgi:hypothetical protein